MAEVQGDLNIQIAGLEEQKAINDKDIASFQARLIELTAQNQIIIDGIANLTGLKPAEEETNV